MMKGKMISAYYTQGHEEQLHDFQPVYINIGGPNQAKELVGPKKNTRFVRVSKKSQHESANTMQDIGIEIKQLEDITGIPSSTIKRLSKNTFFEIIKTMVSNIWINKVMQDIHKFMDVYSSNELTPLLSYPTWIIAKLFSSYEERTHFLPRLFKKDLCIYFDPLNLSFIPTDI